MLRKRLNLKAFASRALLAAGFVCWSGAAHAQVVYTKLDNATPLDQAASWTPAAIPTGNDTITWNGSYSSNAASVGAGLSVRQVQVGSVSSPITLTAGTGNLSVGSGGMDLSGATRDVTVAAPMRLTAAQSWLIAGGRMMLATGSITNNAAFSLIVNGASSNGTLVLSPAAGSNITFTGNASSAMLVQVRNGGALILGGDGVFAPVTASVNTLVTSGAQGALALTGNGTVRVHSGTWNFGDLGRNGSADFFSGTLDVRGGAIAFNGARFLAGGNITVSGGSLKFGNVGSIYSNGGKFALGSSGTNATATMTISGGSVDWAQANSAVNGGNSLGLTINSRILQTGGTAQSGVTAGGGTNGGTTNTFNIGSTGLSSTGSGNSTTYTALNVLASYTLSGGILLSAGTIQATTPAAPGTNGSTATPPNVTVNPGAGNVRNFNFVGGTLATASYNATYLGYASANGTAGDAPNVDPTANSVGLGTLYNHGGTLAPGGIGTAGRTAITGNYVVRAGALAIDLGGTTQATAFQTGQYDLLTVSGSTVLSGNLSVNLISGYTPAANATFTILTSTGNLTGQFYNVPFGSRVVSTNGLATFVVSKSGNNVTLGQYLAVTAPTIAGILSPGSVVQGSSVTLSASANSLAPVTYQWRKNGVAIDGATSSTLIIGGATVDDAGNYDVVISNAAGSVTSSSFPLTVTLPRVAQVVTIDAGTSQTFSATPSATAFAWKLNGAPVGNGTASYTYGPDVNAVGTHWLKVRETYSDNSSYERQWMVRVRIPQPAATIKYYVSPTGSDSNSGSIGAPFRTLEKARDTLRTLGRPLPTGGAVVYLRGGTHTRNSTFTLNATDSGSAGAPVVYTSYPGETAIISGGKSILASQFSPLASSELSRVAPGVDTSRIWELDLPSAGITRRGPFPASYNEWQIYSPLSGSNANIGELFYNGKRMPLSRYPNRNLIDDRLTTNLKMNGVAAGNATDGSGYLNGAGNYTMSNGTITMVGGAFHYSPNDAARVSRWQTALSRGGLWVVGYWRVAWQVNGARVTFIDEGKQAFGFATNTSNASNALVSGGIGNKYSRPAGSKNEPYWVVNLLEELDQPGEWCIDFSRNKLYFLMDAAGAPPDNSVVLTDGGTPLVQISGNYTTFQSVGFQYGLGQAVVISGGSRNLVTGCTFKNIGGYGVDINNLPLGGFNGVVSNTMSDLGAGGVLCRGGDNKLTPRTPLNNYIVNNRIADYARVVRVYAAAVDVGFQYGGDTVGGVRVAHNTTTGSPHVGMLWRDYDNVYEYNDISDYCQFSEDMGGIYTFNSNYVSNTTIRYNYVHNSDLGEGIYFDSDHINAIVYGNVVNLQPSASSGRSYGFYDQSVTGTTPTAGVPITDTYYNNIAVNCRYGFQIYSAPGGIIENNAAYNNSVGAYRWNLIGVGNGTYTSVSSNATALGSGPNLSYASDPGFLDFANDDLRLRPTAQLYADMPGFERIPMEMIGLYNDEFRSDAKIYPPLITSTAPTNVGANTATLNGELVYPQFNENTTVLLYWGTVDGGANAGSWQNVASLGAPASGVVSQTLSGLAPETQYFYRLCATNSAGTDWADQSIAFTTYAAQNAATSGNVTASSGAGSAALAFDGDAGTVWQTGAGVTTGWIQFQFAGGAAVVVTQYRVTSAPDSPARDPRDWQFLGSNDGVNWTTLDVRTGETFSSRGQTNSYAFANTTDYRFYRLNVTANNGDPSGLQIADVQLISPVIIGDTAPPVISTPGNLSVPATSAAGVVVTFTVTAIDARAGYVTPTITPASGSLFGVGTTTVNVTASDPLGNTANTSFTVTVTPPSLPSPWSQQRISAANFTGGAAYSAGNNGTFNVVTGGGDISTTESFTYVWQPWTGNGTFTARVGNFTCTDTNGKAGIMFREGLTTGARSAFAFMTAGGASSFQTRLSANATVSSNATAGRGIPEWIRLVRSGSTFTAFSSPDGVTWTQQGSATTVNMTATPLYVGLAVGPRTGATANVTFDNVSFAGLPAAPAGLAATSASAQVNLTWSVVPGATTYTVRRGSSAAGPFAVIAGNLTATTYADSGLTAGSTFFYVVSAVNSFGEGAASAVVSGSALSLIDAWRVTNFGNATASGNAADDADPDNDGVPNFLEYGLAGDPLARNGTVLPQPAAAAGRLQVTFARVADPALTYTVEGTSSLTGNWTSIWQSTGAANTAGSITVNDTIDLNATNPPGRYLRLRVTSP